jgi:hypothetical protein
MYNAIRVAVSLQSALERLLNRAWLNAARAACLASRALDDRSQSTIDSVCDCLL